MVSTTCPSCSHDLEIDAKLLGKGVLCPYCHKLFVPPFPHSGFAVAACFLGPVAIVLEFFLLVYALIGTNWHTSFLPAERLRPFMGFLGFASIVLTWIGITCAGFAFTQKKRRRSSAKWGLILNVLPNVFCCGYMVVRLWLPAPAPPRETPVEPPAETTGEPEGRIDRVTR
jgi:hypothetical protein